MQNAHDNEKLWAFSPFPDSGKVQKALGQDEAGSTGDSGREGAALFDEMGAVDRGVMRRFLIVEREEYRADQGREQWGFREADQ